MDNTRSRGSAVPIVLLAWFAGAASFAATIKLASLPKPVIPLFILTPVALVLLAYFRSATTRAVVDAIDLRWLIALHIVRAPIGAAFLVYESRGELIKDFAFPAAAGDILAGVMAVAALLAVPMVTRGRYRLVRIWCIIGLLDMIMVVISAQRVIFFRGGFDAMAAFNEFPFPMLPLFLVPLIISSHVIILQRLRDEPARVG